MGESGLRYRAFLSYSHRDSRITARLHRRLEGFRLPRGVQPNRPGATPPERLAPVFRDRDELASAERLSASIEQALDESAALIVVCSPAAAASPWVEQEIRYFRQRHPQRPVFAFVAVGEPGLDPRLAPGQAAFPLALALADIEHRDGPLGEPIAADAREQGDGFGNAFLKLAAGLLDVRYASLHNREQRRRQQRWALAGAACLLLTLSFAFLAWQATVARDAAQSAQARAELELTSERQTRGFLLSVFQLADASEARGNTVTVREVLDRAVARIDETQFSRPEIRSRYLATLGQAYASLGLNRRSAELLAQSVDSVVVQGPEQQQQSIESLIELGFVLFDMGEYDEALRRLEQVHQVAGDHTAMSPMQRARAANARASVLMFQEEDEEAGRLFQTALETLHEAVEPGEAERLARAQSLTGLAMIEQFSGRHEAAERLYGQAISAWLEAVGEFHPGTIGTLSQRASNAHAMGERELAQVQFERALELARRVYDEHSPQIGTLKNNLGRLALEQGDATNAEPLLREALDSDRRHRSETFDDLAFSLNNLALVRRMQGDADEARTLLTEALPIAEGAGHPMLGQILAGLADIACTSGEAEAGLAWAERAVAAEHERDPSPRWQIDDAELTRAYCRHHQGQAVAEDAVRAWRAAIEQRWPDASPFAQRAQRQSLAILAGTDRP